MIQTIGDSHCWHAWLKIPGVITNTIGPMLMHTLGMSKAIMVKEIPKDDTIIFCWGEIDCRCHVHKFQPWKETIDELVEKYLDVIRLNVEFNKNILLFNVVPPPRKEKTQENLKFPFLGSDEERLSYVKYMNKKLSESEFGFIDVYDKYADSDGFLNMAYSDNHVHIADPIFIIEWLQHRRLI